MKILMQRLWELKVDWDDPLPPGIHDAWLQWWSELKLLSDKHLPRCYFPESTVTSLSPRVVLSGELLAVPFTRRAFHRGDPVTQDRSCLDQVQLPTSYQSSPGSLWSSSHRWQSAKCLVVLLCSSPSHSTWQASNHQTDNVLGTPAVAPRRTDTSYCITQLPLPCYWIPQDSVFCHSWLHCVSSNIRKTSTTDAGPIAY